MPVPEPEPNEPHMIGYARVSTADQNAQLQIDALLRAGVDPRDIFEEKISGTAKHRPQFEAMMKDIRPGDVVVVWKLDRLGRNNVGLHQAAQRIREKGAHLKLLDNSGLDTSTAAGRLLFGMLAVLAQFESDINRERTVAGLQAARERGTVGGRRQYMEDDEIIKLVDRYGMKSAAKRLEGTYSPSGLFKAYKRAIEHKVNGKAAP